MIRLTILYINQSSETLVGFGNLRRCGTLLYPSAVRCKVLVMASFRPDFRGESFRPNWGGSFRPNFKGGSFRPDFRGESFRPDLFIL